MQLYVFIHPLFIATLLKVCHLIVSDWMGAIAVTAHLVTVLVTWRSTYVFVQLNADLGRPTSIQGVLLAYGKWHIQWASIDI